MYKGFQSVIGPLLMSIKYKWYNLYIKKTYV
jgi:hypothetical protein